MGLDPGEWQMEHWGPSAPESRVLLYGPKGQGKEVFKLAVLELISRRRLAPAEEQDLSEKVSLSGLLSPGPETRPTRHRPLDVVSDLFDEVRSRPSDVDVPGAYLFELARETKRRYGSFDGYVKAEVLPALERRGLYKRRKRRLLPASRWELTRSGEAARAHLERNRELGEQHFAGWVEEDPARARRFIGAAGSSLLLMEALHPSLIHLAEEEEEYDAAPVSPFTYAGAAGSELDPDALDGLGDALSALESWSDGRSSDGGGWFDGGGGGFDGGGGGGSDGGGGGGGF